MVLLIGFKASHGNIVLENICDTTALRLMVTLKLNEADSRYTSLP